MRGFQTQTKRKAHANGYAGGGMVRGPGTGISDDVPDQVPEGTYIMPADSTAQLGPDKLAGMGARGFKAGGKKAAGAKSVPVNLSNGEFKMPPEQVHAVGVQALEQMKNATHTPAAQQAGEPEMFFANGGPVFGSRGLEGLKAMIPKVAAMGFPQKQAAPVAPAAPAQGSRNVADLKAVIPQMEAMGFKQNPQYLADGGPVRREEGGGLSKEAVMAAIAKQAAQQQPAAQPAQQPAARGFSRPAADFLRNPGGILAQRERQAGGYADGGMVDEERQRLANQTAMYVRGAQEAAATRAPQPQPAAVTPMATQQAPAVAPAAPSTSPSTLYMQDRAQELKDQVGQGNYAQAAGTAARTAVQGLGMYGIELADKAGTPLINAARGFGRGVLGSDDGAAPSTAPVAAPPAAPAPAAVPPAAPSAAGADRGSVNPPVANPSAPTPAPANAPAAATEIMPGVYSHGRGQYSDNAAGMGFKPSFTGQPNAQNMAAAGNLANRQRQESMDRVAGRGVPGSGPVEPGSFTGGFSGVVGSASTYGNMRGRSPEQRLRDAEVSASSIMNRPKWGGRGAENSAAMLEYRAALQQDRDIRQNQAGADIEAQRQAAGIQREGMQQDGATTRTGMTEQGANTREAGRNALATGELGLRREAQGFQTRAAQQQEQLRNVILDPKATPAQKRQAQESLRALGGKAEDNRFTVVPGGQEWDATAGAMRNVPARVLNNQTGQFVDQGGGAQAPTQARPVGTVSKVGNRTAVWDGQKWVPQ